MKRNILNPIAILIFISLGSGCTTPGSIKPTDLKDFKSDACSMFPEGTKEEKNLWCHCCLEHDKVYWKGGTSRERKEADNVLKKCVKKAGEEKIAQLMLTGVRVGGTPYLPSQFRWGYGWPYLRGYKDVSVKMEEYEQSGGNAVCRVRVRYKKKEINHNIAWS